MSASETITRTDLTNILNAILPSGGGGLLVPVTVSGNSASCGKSAGEIKDVLDASGMVLFSSTSGSTTTYATLKTFIYNSNTGDVDLNLNGITNDTLSCNGLNNYPAKSGGGGGGND